MTHQSDLGKRDLLFLDDLRPGQRFVTATKHVGEAEIIAFAQQFDAQPFHLDAAAAKASVFAGLAASGWHTAAITMQLLVKSGAPIAGGLVGLGGEINWPRPTRPGDTLVVESEIVEVTPSRSKADRGIVTMRNETKNQRGEIVQVFTVKMVVPRRSAGE